MTLEFELAGSQIDGARDYQEDAFLITHLTDANGNPSALVVIADGMGGHAAGNVASNMAVQALNKHVSANYPSDNIPEILENAVVKANNSIKETIAETPALSGMGCTMVAAILEEGKLFWASVGDSHCYLVRNRELSKKNADHSYGGFLDRMEADGTPVDAEPGLSRNMLVSAITGEDINQIDVPSTPFELEAGDKILLCSDGLDTLSSGKIIQYSDWSDSPKECTEALMEAVKEADMPRQDNTTAVVVNVKDSVTAPVSVAKEPSSEKPVAQDILETTAEMSITDITAENEATDDIPAAKETPVQQEFDTFEQPKSKTGLFIGIAAAIVIIIGAGAFFTMGGQKQSRQKTVVAVEAEPEIVEAEPETTEEIIEVGEEVAVAVVEKKKPEVAETKTSSEKTIQDDFKSGGKGPLMVWIPEGEFTMGTNKQFGEGPKHSVSIRKFAISAKEITISEYSKYATATDVKIPKTKGLDPDFPVFMVSWDDAYNYTKWLSRETGEKYRLLSEAEWEYAASGGKKTPFWWGYNMEKNKAHCFMGCNQVFNTSIPMQTGSFEPNPFGVYDTQGNISEWVHDCWHDNYKGAPSDESVWEGGDCTQRVVRGGAFISPEQSLRTASRDKYKSNSAYEFIGIRVAREN